MNRTEPKHAVLRYIQLTFLIYLIEVRDGPRYKVLNPIQFLDLNLA